MAPSRAIIERNLQRIRQRMTEAALRSQRPPDAVRLIAVTKSVGVAEAEILAKLGVADLAENRPELAAAKISAIGPRVRWHMIGNLQRRKAGDVTALFDTVDAIDRIEAAQALDAKCAIAAKVMPILVEVNVSGEASKHGFIPAELDAVLARLAECASLRVDGLMTMAPFVSDPETVRPVFAALRQLVDRHRLPECSMGMSNDFDVAIEEGATQVRIGSALFE